MTEPGISPPHLTRRSVIVSAGAAVYMATRPISAHATTATMQAAITDMFGERPLNMGRVSLTIPPISENGYSVAMDVEVDSPMTEDDHVKQIAIFSARNPIPLIARYHLSPRSGRARVTGRIRLGGTQYIHAVAQMHDGKLYTAATETIVTVAACVVL